jgi:hypothetical protein
MFKQLNLLPSDRFEYTTAGNLIDRYVGGTGQNTLEAMRRAKGGYVYVYVCLYVCMYMYVCICIFVHTHAHHSKDY